MKHLNGWQRLWVVSVSLHGVAAASVFGYLLSESPSPATPTDVIRALADRPAFEALTNLPLERKKDLARDTARARVRLKKSAEHGYKTSDEEFARRVQKDWSGVVSLPEMAVTGVITPRRLRIGVYGLLVWLLPSCAVYALGCAVGWVARGFRKSDA